MRYKLFVLAALAGMSVGAGAAETASLVAKQAEKMFLESFRSDNPKYWMRRLEQDEAMRLCSTYKDNPPAKIRQQIQLKEMATIRYPVDGKLIGDWMEGEKLASSGRGGHIGFIQPDPRGTPRGGNCYACHELSPREVAYGTIGPSLKHFGRTRGNGEDVIKYVYDKVYNSNAFSACTNMPRFGYHSWLTPEQITHIVAYLLDPESPVNGD
ncbi:MAG: sulfur oxidation c-type cytochrome SoxX [Rhodocyclaceae bacterium]|nr:sulfur oxidation c-type cytochrome SoxX [Rhodocyclaceae bacterium]MBX3670231.1 sulfur oxidation c-type cytochrome SoxX [Rhodocyclaceae bacterium]